MDITVTPLNVPQAGAPDDALDEVIANQAECHISQDSPYLATIAIRKDGDTRRFAIGVINPGPDNRMVLLVNETPPGEFIPQPDAPDHMLRHLLPHGSVHLETLSDTACYIGLSADTFPPTSGYGLIIATARGTGTLALTPAA